MRCCCASRSRKSAADAPEAAATIETLRARFDASRARGDSVHRREEARFRACSSRRSEERAALALENWMSQREPSDLRILAEAAPPPATPPPGTPCGAGSRKRDSNIRPWRGWSKRDGSAPK